MPDAERRRRLAAVYRLLIELSRQQQLAGEQTAALGEPGSQGKAANDSLSIQEAVHA